MKVSTRTALAVVAAATAVVAGALLYRHFALLTPLLDKVKADLNDPDSAQFRNVKVFGDWSRSEVAVCGEVNAKNRMGGYVGYTSFIVTPAGADIESDDVKSLYDKGTLQRCPFERDDYPWWGVPF